MSVRWVTGFLDGPDRSAVPFWQAVTSSGLSSWRAGRFATLLPADGDAYLRVQVTDSAAAGGHLDLHTDEVRVLAARAQGLGARRVFADGDELVVFRSPAGLPFCVVRWDGERVRPRPAGAAVVDQFCLDVPVAAFEAEADFWSALTGWARQASDLPEFGRLAAAPGMPLRILLQRVGSAVAGMHPDLACDDVDGEVARHVGLGAREVRRTDQWVTLMDPAGREYCVTMRPVSSW